MSIPPVRLIVPLAAAGALAVSGCGADRSPAGPGAGATDVAATTTTTGSPGTPGGRTRITRWPAREHRSGATDVTVQLSAAPVPGSPRPTLSPRVAGTWSTHGTTEVFTPKGTLTPCSRYVLRVPASTTGAGQTPLGRTSTAHLAIACPTIRGVEHALAHLHYLPVRVVGGGVTRLHPGKVTRHEAALQLFRPTGRLARRWSSAPRLGDTTADPVLRGAIMAFQHRRGLTPDGQSSQALWRALLLAESQGQTATPYTWVTVHETGSESLTVHRAGHVVLRTPANTGAPGAETAPGTFPIFEHVAASDMRGTNPDGSHYDDPGVPWVNYFNGGDAVHGFARATYGSRQSAGCVELPIPTAEKVFGMLDIGDLVTVES
ncbi:L,D-transpeptidase family protein [Patulibacter minatonensis]|uniref:L,D-transpeptidase family protein n=1 Tax=Patulibacter minatonensis TaxID=298163 RepID=UPI000686AC63|nr:L,D-transpeptidase family protein [Patulibacter minatonensis]